MGPLAQAVARSGSANGESTGAESQHERQCLQELADPKKNKRGKGTMLKSLCPNYAARRTMHAASYVKVDVYQS